MVLKMFAIFDSKASAFMLPFFCPNLAVAKRTVVRAVSDPSSDFSLFREDYSLFEVGEWEPDTGKVSVCTAPVNHGLLAQFVPSLEVVK